MTKQCACTYYDTGCRTLRRVLFDVLVCFYIQDGTTPLFMACQDGHETVVKLLLDGGSDVNKATDVSKSHVN